MWKKQILQTLSVAKFTKSFNFYKLFQIFMKIFIQIIPYCSVGNNLNKKFLEKLYFVWDLSQMVTLSIYESFLENI